MTWVRLDDQFTDHPKIVQAGPLAGWLFVCGLGYAARYLTDGSIPAAQVRRLADVEDAEPLAARLVAAGLWEPVEGGYQVSSAIPWGIRRSEVYEEWAQMRATVSPLIFERDGYKCQYCGRLADLTIDHILPLSRGGSNNRDNLTTACRSCNSAKGDRTPEEWHHGLD
jgi:5-methylcytosine-specific restriction endonuclease McrA